MPRRNLQFGKQREQPAAQTQARQGLLCVIESILLIELQSLLYSPIIVRLHFYSIQS